MVIAHVAVHPAVPGDTNSDGFVLEVAKRGVLHRPFPRALRIDLDDPAETVVLVGIAGIGQVESLVEFVPSVAETTGAEAVADLLFVRLVVHIVPAEVAVEVLFAGQVRAPRREAIAAVVHSPQRSVTSSVLQEPGAGNRTVKSDRRVHGNATVSPIVLDVPLAPSTGDAHNRATMSRL